MAAAFLQRGQQLCLLALITLLPLIAIAQGQIHYDHKARINVEIAERLYIQTIRCLRTATLAIMQQGVREHGIVLAFNVGMCGKPLHQHLTVTMGWESRDAAELIAELSNRTVASLTTTL